MQQMFRKVPILGICMPYNLEQLKWQMKSSKGMYGEVHERLKRYQDKDASFIMFGWMDLNFKKKNVRGFLYDQEKGWKEGVFPFPDAIYLRSRIHNNVLNQMQQIIGPKVFNSFLFDKWQAWNVLVAYPDVMTHLPQTEKADKETGLRQFLETHKDIFLKPVHGCGGKGVIHASLQQKGNIKAIYQNKRKTTIQTFNSCKALWNWIPKLSLDSYIMQKTIQTVSLQNKPTDIRLNMNKNRQGEWEVSALIFRQAINGSHVGTGMGVQYSPVHTIQFLKEIYADDLSKVEAAVQSVVDLGYKICRALDESPHHMADLGIDLGLDKDGKLWIFEVNPTPTPFGAAVHDHSYTRPLEYGAYLAELNDNSLNHDENKKEQLTADDEERQKVNVATTGQALKKLRKRRKRW